ncbi:MAG: hypothetical protein KA314_14345 [Chloroflexi bacterium]|nr:hypothetical protein [Chloroflexota bacterium]MBP8057013.1 hypothetical protein [Chloroflexota bacterium]
MTGPMLGVAAAFPFHYPSPGQFLALRPRFPTLSSFPHHKQASFGCAAAFPLANPLSCTITGPALGVAAAFPQPSPFPPHHHWASIGGCGRVSCPYQPSGKLRYNQAIAQS